METKKTSNETFMESVKMAEKWISDNNEAMMDVYNKQLNLSTGFFTNLFNTALTNNTGFSEGKNLTDLMFNTNITKLMLNPFITTGHIATNPFITSIEKAYKQLLSYNNDVIESYSSMIKRNQTDLKTTSEEYVDVIENQLEASKNILNSVSEAFTKQLDLSFESNKKIIKEINNQSNSVVKENQKFLNDLIKTNPVSSNGDGKKGKDSHQHSGEKRWKAPVEK